MQLCLFLEMNFRRIPAGKLQLNSAVAITIPPVAALGAAAAAQSKSAAEASAIRFELALQWLEGLRIAMSDTCSKSG